MSAVPCVQLRLGNTDAVALIDADAAPEVTSCAWWLDKAGYVVRRYVAGRHQFLHRLVMGAPAGRFVDHLDRDPLNNLRSNLRIVTPTENTLNKSRRVGTSVFRGVARCPKTGKWQVYLNRKYVGLFRDELDAAEAWLVAASPVYGEINIAQDRAAVAAARALLSGAPTYRNNLAFHALRSSLAAGEVFTPRASRLGAFSPAALPGESSGRLPA